jgi:hypothetical protein
MVGWIAQMLYVALTGGQWCGQVENALGEDAGLGSEGCSVLWWVDCQGDVAHTSVAGKCCSL